MESHHLKAAFQGKSVNWDALFQNYQSIVDFPGAIYYQQLAQYYPDAKVILTVRDPEQWYNSVYNTIFKFDPGPAIKLKMLFSMPFSSTSRNLFQVIQLNDQSIWEKYFESNFKNKDYAIQKFNDHIKEVKKNIPADRLLTFQVKEGWEPLCRFLNCPIPNEAFPSINKRGDFHSWANGIVKEVLA